MTYGPVAGDTGPAQPPRTYVGLLVGLVVVLVMMCGGIAFTAWRFVGTGTGDRSAVSGPTPRRAVQTSGPDLPTPVPSDPAVPSGPVTPTAQPLAGSPAVMTPPAGQSVVPARGSLVPFGLSHAVAWPDGLRAVVMEARPTDLPAGLADTYPADTGVVIEVELDNYTANDLTIDQAQTNLWYGSGRTAADQLVDLTGPRDLTGTVRSGGSKLAGMLTFAVPRQYLSQLVFEVVPRLGDAPAHFFGGAA
jgi:hypothetical protein